MIAASCGLGAPLDRGADASGVDQPGPAVEGGVGEIGGLEHLEEAAAAELFTVPLHPYTQGLLSATPRLETATGAHRADRPRLHEIPGMVPTLKGELIG